MTCRYNIIIIFSVLILYSKIRFSAQKLLHGPYHPLPVFEICPSRIYCQGELLPTVESSNILTAFQNMMMIRNPSDVIENFNKLKAHGYNGSIPFPMLRMFIKENFVVEHGVLINWLPIDFKNYPLVIGFIQDIQYKEFAAALNQMWLTLAKRISVSVRDNPERYSMIYVPNGFFLNSENDNEFQYWDTYWIIKGALICGMRNTVKGILENLIHMIKINGYVMYGNRVYYGGRSQPPLLIQMMAVYYTFTNDKDFIFENIEFLDDEMMFWLLYRSMYVKSNGNTYIMGHYMSDTTDPRPEKYAFDMKIAKNLPQKRDRDEYYCRVKAASESGWGISSKHFHNRVEFENRELMYLKTNPLNFVYVELNAILQSNSAILSKMYLLKDDKVNEEFYRKLAQRYQIGINSLLWNEKENIWLDFDSSIENSRNNFYASNLAPLWTFSYDNKLSEFYGDAAVDYLIRNNIINSDLTPRYICIPTSLYKSGLEWDDTNCWPQLQSMIIFGLQATRSERAKIVASNFASSWMHTNFVGYKNTNSIFQKYSAVKLGSENNEGELFDIMQPKANGVSMGLLFEIFHEWGNVLESKQP
ncbi:Six-hairpin glycosidase-like,Glycoside hydrolase, family 37 [Cinara cedri]|uniref:Trehalase n=1 Tax=Cinara cedri TaxID=506608 RepID=A0A5E4NIB5_9HEMI|nr:Six-hairpin glycosidase-like,Glycoside hydrolase, family 37 [Cinara cedri]